MLQFEIRRQGVSTLKLVSISAQSQAMGLFLGFLRKTKFQQIISLSDIFNPSIIMYFCAFFDLQIVTYSSESFHFSNIGRVLGHSSKVDPHKFLLDKFISLIYILKLNP